MIISLYFAKIQSQQKRKIIKADVTVDGEYINVKYEFKRVSFDRIPIITGYLLSTMDRWNNGKQAKLNYRVKQN